MNDLIKRKADNNSDHPFFFLCLCFLGMTRYGLILKKGEGKEDFQCFFFIFFFQQISMLFLSADYYLLFFLQVTTCLGLVDKVGLLQDLLPM